MLSPSSLLCLPPEIIDDIAFELSALQPLGPPSILLPFLQTCRTIFNALTPRVNSSLWAKIFRYKFDSSALERRIFSPTADTCVAQLKRYCLAMQVLRLEHCRGGPESFVQVMSLEDALMTAVIMMLEDDGKNSRQLCEWAHADRLVNHLIRNHIFEHRNNGWPVENKQSSSAMWLMWMLTSEESLRNETPEECAHLNSLLLPFVVLQHRYPSFEAPPQYFRLPFPSPISAVTTGTQAFQDKYPAWPPGRTTPEIHYNTPIFLNVPLIAPAAKLLFFARQEMTPLLSPPHLAKDRAEWLSRGHLGMGPTKADIDEYNWGWSVRLPLGSSASLGTMSNAIWERGGEDDECEPKGKEILAVNVSNPRWGGKAPHTLFASSGLNSKSRRWDVDWWRMHLCGDPMVMRASVSCGRIYEPGCMDGLWQGRMLFSTETELEALLTNPLFPGVEFDEQSTSLVVQPFYARFREAHAVVGYTGDDFSLGTTCDSDGENMCNAWFEGKPGSTTFQIRNAHGDEDDGEVAEIGVVDGAGNERAGVFRCWRGSNSGKRLGQGYGAFSQVGEGLSGKEESRAFEATSKMKGQEDERGWMGYPHDPAGCDGCLARLRVTRKLEKERRDHEQLFSSVGLGLDEVETEGDEDAIAYASERCDGVREIYLVGETEGRQRDAWGRYEFYGRVRKWDGLIGVVRTPRGEGEEATKGCLFCYGYLVGGENWVGSWRITGANVGGVGYEGAFVMSRYNS